MHWSDRQAVQQWSKAHPMDLSSLECSESTQPCFQEIASGIYTGQPWPAEWHATFSDCVEKRIERATSAGLRLVPPNSMNRYGAILSDLGFEKLTQSIVERVIEPFAKQAYPEVAACGLDAHHAFIVEYSPDTDDHLSWHVDDAEVTLNLCLGKVFSGGDLLFRGRRCAWHRDSAWSDDEVVQLAHEPGTAIIHAGANRHEALPVVSGFRRNLIIWCISNCYRERVGQECPRWCPDHSTGRYSWNS